jgi:hypothetical protein
VSASAEASAQDPAPQLDAVESRPALSGALAIAAPVAYLAGLGTVIAVWGIPIAPDQLFLWLLLGLAAFSVAAWRTWGAMLLAWLPLLALLVVYEFLRGAVTVAPAQAHIAPQLGFDRWLAAGAVPTLWLQQHLWGAHPRWYDYGVWAVYMTHFFAVWVVAAWLWRTRRERFPRYAIVTAALTMAAFVVYWRYPAQPPWMAADDLRIGALTRVVPTVWDQLGVRTVSSVYENRDVVNPVAAMPSLHAAYPAMLLLFFWGAGRRVRAALALYTLAMGFTLVYSGEHFVADVLAGWLLAGVVYASVAVAARSRTLQRAARLWTRRWRGTWGRATGGPTDAMP